MFPKAFPVPMIYLGDSLCPRVSACLSRPVLVPVPAEVHSKRMCSENSLAAALDVGQLPGPESPDNILS